MKKATNPISGEKVLILDKPTPKSFWAYQAPEAPANPPENFNGTREEWLQLSPGFRREIARQSNRKA